MSPIPRKRRGADKPGAAEEWPSATTQRASSHGAAQTTMSLGKLGFGAIARRIAVILTVALFVLSCIDAEMLTTNLLFAMPVALPGEPVPMPKMFKGQKDPTSVGAFYTPEAGRELRATQRIRRGEAVIRAPKKVIMSHRDMLPADGALGRAASEAYSGNPIHPLVRLALGVLAAHLGGDDAKRAGTDRALTATAKRWLRDVLPIAPNTSYPFVGTTAEGEMALDDELNALFDGVEWIAQAGSGGPRALWRAYHFLAQRILPSASTLVARSVFAAVNSRAYTQRLPWLAAMERAEGTEAEGAVGAADDAHEAVLIPLLDLVNHHPDPNVMPRCDADGCAHVATAKVLRGEELRVSYGAQNEISLIHRWGFVPSKPTGVGVRFVMAGCRFEIGGTRGVDEEGRACLQAAFAAKNGLDEKAAKKEVRRTVRRKCGTMLEALRAGGSEARLKEHTDAAARQLAVVWARVGAQLTDCLAHSFR